MRSIIRTRRHGWARSTCSSPIVTIDEPVASIAACVISRSVMAIISV